MNISCKAPVFCAVIGASLISAAASMANDGRASPAQDDDEASRRASPLVNKVRAATRGFRDINAALSDGWVPGTPCVSGPNEGAMGVHMIKPERVQDGELNASEPEALIYEPLPGGRMRLVGVEFIVLAEDWDTRNPDAQPELDGHLLNFVPAPNRYRLPAFYEIHVWAWERNPNGNFADWNTRVSCDSQPSD